MGRSSVFINLKENKTHQNLFAGILMSILVLITYWGAGKNQFVDWDDNEYVVDNYLVNNPKKESLKDVFTTVVSLNYHPLTILSLRANSNVCKTCKYGISPRPFIRGNIILHILNTLLVLILIYKLTGGNILIAFLVSALFGVHPMHVESVAWISGRKDLLYAFFFLSGLLAYLEFLKERRARYLWLTASFILFIFSCLSKATAVVFPVVAILLNFWIYYTGEEKPVREVFKKAFSPSRLIILLPFFAVSVFVGLMAASIQNGNNFLGLFNFIRHPQDVINTSDNISLFHRFQVASYGFVMYIVKFFFPVKLSTLYPYPTQAEFSQGSLPAILWLTFSVTIFIAYIVIRSLRKTRLYFFSIGFYFVTVALVLQFVSVGMAIMADRYTYLPYIGLSLIPATIIADSPAGRKKILLILSACFLLVMMILSKNQIKTWHDSETLWTQVIKHYPHLAFARGARGKYLYMMSSMARNEKEKKMLEEKAMIDLKEAIKAGSKSAEVYEDTGVLLVTKGDPKDALPLLNIAISLEPRKGRAYYNRAMIYDQLDKKEEAIKDYNMALIYSPEFTLEILSNRSVLFIETGKYKEAIADLDYLISINNKDDKYFVNRGFARLKLNDISGAIEDYKSALKLNPKDKMTQEQLQVLLDNQLQ